MGSFERVLEELIRRVLREEVASGSLNRGTNAAAAQPDSAPPSKAGLSRLNHAVNDILRPTVQTDILGAALRGAMTLAERSVLFVRRGDNFSAWRSEGFSDQTGSAMRAITVSTSQPGIFKEILDTHRSVCGPQSSGALPQAMEQALGSTGSGPLCLLPVIVQGKVVAALYADNCGDAVSEEMSGLEIVARVTGLSLETAASRMARNSAAAPAAEASAPMVAAAESAPLETSPAVDSPPSRGSFADEFPVSDHGTPDLPPPPDADSLPDAERDSHKKAHRFARVAVQDLLSYHRDKIEQGRRNKNLFTVLKEDIDKTRQNYQSRFGQTPARHFDYLHYEMVSKLAGNDPSVLGEQYPGPWAGE
jgi:hypothetical protein